jgi:hypothetical protein
MALGVDGAGEFRHRTFARSMTHADAAILVGERFLQRLG